MSSSLGNSMVVIRSPSGGSRRRMRRLLRSLLHLRSRHRDQSHPGCSRPGIEPCRARPCTPRPDRRLCPSLPDSATTGVGPEDCDRVVLARNTTRYRDALTLARLILAQRAPELRAGEHSVFAVLFDMNALWEHYVGWLFRRHPLPLGSRASRVLQPLAATPRAAEARAARHRSARPCVGSHPAGGGRQVEGCWRWRSSRRRSEADVRLQSSVRYGSVDPGLSECGGGVAGVGRGILLTARIVAVASALAFSTGCCRERRAW
jgi:hypothetical protein